MLLAIDAGNTNTVFAVYDGDKKQAVWRRQTQSAATADEYASFLHPLFDAADLSFAHITDCLISSVVPEANFHLRRTGERVFNASTGIVGKDNLDLGMVIKLNRPEEVGADRLVNAVAVKAHHSCPAIVVDFGTATTFDVIDGEGAYAGGVIAPGINLSMEALHRAAAKLPKVSIHRTESVIGRDTITAMQSGIYWGYIGLIEGMISRMVTEMKAQPLVIATGGLASLFSGGTELIRKVDEDLTLKGLVRIHQMNLREKQAA